MKSSPAKKQVRILLADDHTLVRAGIRALLQKVEGIEIVGEAADGLQAIELINSQQPDVVLLDWNMPKVSGIEVLKKASEKFPSMRFIVLTVYDTDEYVVQALRAGAHGFIPKSGASAELERAIDTVSRGEDYLSPQISQQAILKYLKGGRTSSSPHPLTPRQLEILELVAKGQSTREIARRLNITVKTVETHRAQLMERLDIHDIAGLVRYAIKVGLVMVDE